MKLIFFLIAFSLVSLRVYFSWSGKAKERKGLSESNMVIKSENFYEQIKYSGMFQFNDDETAFKSISPGGYFIFRRNEESVRAESNLQGIIEYRIHDGKNNLALDGPGKKLVAGAIHEMIVMGFDASARMDRIYQHGGSEALLREIDSMKLNPVKIIYLNRLLAIDSLSAENFSLLIQKIKSLGSDRDKVDFLNRISPTRWNSPPVSQIWFEVVNSLGSDMDKANAINYRIDRDSLSKKQATELLDLSSKIGSDMERANLYRKFIDKGLIHGSLFDSCTNRVSEMSSDRDKTNLYSKLLAEQIISEEQWLNLISKLGGLGSDMDKTNLLTTIAARMPKTEALRAAYLKTAKTIDNDSDYGRSVRAIH